MTKFDGLNRITVPDISPHTCSQNVEIYDHPGIPVDDENRKFDVYNADGYNVINSTDLSYMSDAQRKDFGEYLAKKFSYDPNQFYPYTPSRVVGHEVRQVPCDDSFMMRSFMISTQIYVPSLIDSPKHGHYDSDHYISPSPYENGGSGLTKKAVKDLIGDLIVQVPQIDVTSPAKSEPQKVMPLKVAPPTVDMDVVNRLAQAIAQVRAEQDAAKDVEVAKAAEKPVGKIDGPVAAPKTIAPVKRSPIPKSVVVNFTDDEAALVTGGLEPVHLRTQGYVIRVPQLDTSWESVDSALVAKLSDRIGGPTAKADALTYLSCLAVALNTQMQGGRELAVAPANIATAETSFVVKPDDVGAALDTRPHLNHVDVINYMNASIDNPDLVINARGLSSNVGATIPFYLGVADVQ